MAVSLTYECERRPAFAFPKPALLNIAYLTKIVEACHLLLTHAKNHPDQTKFDYWFGDFKGQSLTVFQKSTLHVNAMLGHIDTNPMIFNQIAETTLAKTDQADVGNLKINLGSYWTLNIYSFGELVVTFLHEISHKTPGLMTKDKMIGSDYAYKGRSVELAQTKPDDAFQNAENWGYYVASYHPEAGLASTGSWEFTTNRKDIESKGTAKDHPPTVGAAWDGSYWIRHEDRGCAADDPSLPIVRYKVNGASLTYDRAATPLPSTAPVASAPAISATHVKKAATSDGRHKCPKCGRGFSSISERGTHSVGCTG